MRVSGGSRIFRKNHDFGEIKDLCLSTLTALQNNTTDQTTDNSTKASLGKTLQIELQLLLLPPKRGSRILVGGVGGSFHGCKDILTLGR